MRIARPDDLAPFTWRPLGKTLLIVMGIASLVVVILALWTGVPSWVVPGVVVPIVAVTAWQLHKYYLEQATARGV